MKLCRLDKEIKKGCRFDYLRRRHSVINLQDLLQLGPWTQHGDRLPGEREGLDSKWAVFMKQRHHMSPVLYTKLSFFCEMPGLHVHFEYNVGSSRLQLLLLEDGCVSVFVVHQSKTCSLFSGMPGGGSWDLVYTGRGKKRILAHADPKWLNIECWLSETDRRICFTT